MRRRRGLGTFGEGWHDFWSQTPWFLGMFSGAVIVLAAAIAVIVTLHGFLGGPNDPARVIAEHESPPDSLTILRDDAIQVWAGDWDLKSGPTVRNAIPYRSFTKFGPGILAWNVDKGGAFFIAWEDPDSFDLDPGAYRYRVIFYGPEPDTVEAGIYSVGRGRIMKP